MGYWLYNFFLTLVVLVILPFLPLFPLLGPGFRNGLLERLALYPRTVRERLQGSRPIWIHAVSVGEVLSVARLVEKIKERFPERKILLSTFTSTGSRIARQTITGADAVIFLPLDHPWVVRRAMAVFDPSVLVFLETELWPNVLRQAYRKGVPTILLSGRLSPRSFRHYLYWRPFFSRVVRQLSAAGMQSKQDSGRIIRLGLDSRKVHITGSLKHAPREDWTGNGKEMGEAASLIEGAEGRQVLVVGSTHKGEEEILLEVFLSLKASFPRLIMVLAPRHPQRFAEVERILQRWGVRYEKKSRMNGRGGELPDVIFLDTIGDLSAFYAVADLAFVGGSLVDAGGHNLMEPARFRKPVLFGPYMSNFARVAREMKERGGGIQVSEKGDLVREIAELLRDPHKATRVGDLAYSVVEGDRGVLERSMDLLSRYMVT